jgi:putative transposase
LLKTFKYRLYPNSKTKKVLEVQLRECRYVYNTYLHTRKISYEQTGKSPNYYDFANQLKFWKREIPELKQVHSQVLQDVLKRVDLAYQSFFRRVRIGSNPGYPRFKNKYRYNSITYPQYGNGCYLEDKILHLSKIGTIKVVLHKPISGKIKSLIVKRDSLNKWYVSFSVETLPNILKQNNNAVGIDVGLKSFAVFDTGEKIENPKFLKQKEDKLSKLQSRRDKTPENSKPRKKLSLRIRYLNKKISNQRSDFAHQLSRKIVNQYYIIAVEKLDVQNMMQNGYLAKSIGDAAWTQFRMLLSYKAEEAGRKYVEVDPAYTSQTCSCCSNKKKLELKDRIYSCDNCGLNLDRDHNAAINILAVGLHSLNSFPDSRSPGL